MHTVGPVWRGGEQNEDQLLQDAYLNSLRLVAANSYTSVAFPAISTGVYGYPRAAAAEIAVKPFQNLLPVTLYPNRYTLSVMMKKTPTSTKDSLPNKEMNDLPRLASAVLPLCSQHPGQCGLFPLEKSLDALPPGIVWPKWQSIRWMFSITSGRTICRVGYCFPPC